MAVDRGVERVERIGIVRVREGRDHAAVANAELNALRQRPLPHGPHQPEKSEQKDREEHRRFEQCLAAFGRPHVPVPAGQSFAIETCVENGSIGIAFHQPSRADISFTLKGSEKKGKP